MANEVAGLAGDGIAKRRDDARGRRETPTIAEVGIS
jgi:hypothetical protein